MVKATQVLEGKYTLSKLQPTKKKKKEKRRGQKFIPFQEQNLFPYKLLKHLNLNCKPKWNYVQKNYEGFFFSLDLRVYKRLSILIPSFWSLIAILHKLIDILEIVCEWVDKCCRNKTGCFHFTSLLLLLPTKQRTVNYKNFLWLWLVPVIIGSQNVIRLKYSNWSRVIFEKTYCYVQFFLRMVKIISA